MKGSAAGREKARSLFEEEPERKREGLMTAREAWVATVAMVAGGI